MLVGIIDLLSCVDEWVGTEASERQCPIDPRSLVPELNTV